MASSNAGYCDYIEGIFNSNVVDRSLNCIFSFLDKFVNVTKL